MPAPPEPSTEVLSAIMRDLLRRAGRHGAVALTGDGGDPSCLPGAVVRHLGRMPRSHSAAACGAPCVEACGRRSACALACSGVPAPAGASHRRGSRPACARSPTVRPMDGPSPPPGAAPASRAANRWPCWRRPGWAAILRDRRSEHHRPGRRAAVPFLRRAHGVACPIAAVVSLVREQDGPARGHGGTAARRHPAPPQDGAGRRPGGRARLALGRARRARSERTPAMEALCGRWTLSSGRRTTTGS